MFMVRNVYEAGMNYGMTGVGVDGSAGINRDPAYIYRPVSPRTVYIGIKIGDMVF